MNYVRSLDLDLNITFVKNDKYKDRGPIRYRIDL